MTWENKMHIINNLEFIAYSRNIFRGQGDGIYKRGKDYFITFVHGGEKGELQLQINQFDRFITSPSKIRGQIKKYLDINISKDARVFINPCHAETCMKRWKKSGLKNKVFIVSGKAIDTSFIVFDYEREIMQYYPLDKEKKYIMLVFDYSNSNEFDTINDPGKREALIMNYMTSCKNNKVSQN